MKLQSWHKRSIDLIVKEKDASKSILKPYISKVPLVSSSFIQKRASTPAPEQRPPSPRSRQMQYINENLMSKRRSSSVSLNASNYMQSEMLGDQPKNQINIDYRQPLRYAVMSKQPIKAGQFSRLNKAQKIPTQQKLDFTIYQRSTESTAKFMKNKRAAAGSRVQSSTKSRLHVKDLNRDVASVMKNETGVKPVAPKNDDSNNESVPEYKP